MSAGILALFGVALAAAIIELLIPGEEKNGTRQFLHFLTALTVLLLLLHPFLSFLGNADGFLKGEIEWEEGETARADFEQRFSEAVAAQSAVQLKEGLQDLLHEEYGIAHEDCSIAVELDEDGQPERISVFLSGEALLQDPQAICDALEKRLNCDVEVR